MGRDIQYRKRLLRLLSTNQLEALRNDEMQSSQQLLDALAYNWSSEIESVVRNTVERFIMMARAEKSADEKANCNSSLVIKLKQH